MHRISAESALTCRETLADVLGTFSDTAKAKKDPIDLSKTSTTTFVDQAG